MNWTRRLGKRLGTCSVFYVGTEKLIDGLLFDLYADGEALRGSERNAHKVKALRINLVALALEICVV
jgi:hypothetical protein